MVALVRLQGGIKKRRLDKDSGCLVVTEDLAVVQAPLGPRGSVERDGRVASGVTTGPRRHVSTRLGDGPMIGRGHRRGFASNGRVPFDLGLHPKQGFRPLGWGYLGPPFCKNLCLLLLVSSMVWVSKKGKGPPHRVCDSWMVVPRLCP